MAERTQYTPGTFSWVDLATTDPDAAKSFYGALFGWKSRGRAQQYDESGAAED